MKVIAYQAKRTKKAAADVYANEGCRNENSPILCPEELSCGVHSSGADR